ncbi:MAG: hypothetical protein ACRDHY_14135 [Anaerolineales bacterium]
MPKTSFRPETHGFAFANSWILDETESRQMRDILSSAVNAALMAVSPVLFAPLVVLGLGRGLGRAIAGGLPQVYGLCGGMAFAALDYYTRGLPLPRGTGPSDQPTRKTPKGATLRTYLWQRLLQSLTVGGAGALMLANMAALHLMPKRWPFRGGAPWLLARSKSNWIRLKRHIDAGEPWPIGLVGTTKDPFTNHQVLAYGYDDNGDGRGTIYVYDMNCPGAEQTLRVDFRGESLQAEESCPGARGPLRGFFCEIYSPAEPPSLE